jgi:hypothetical protein
MTSWRLLAKPATFRVLFTGALVLAVVVGVFGLFPVLSQTVTVVGARTEEPIPLDDPWAEIWDDTKAESVPLSAQNIAPPFGGGTVSSVTARVLHDGESMFFLVEWDDESVDESVAGHELFTDGAAVQFPIGGVEAPYTMGGSGLPVNIWHWKAVWQADIDSGFETIQDRLGNTYVDDYQNADEPLFRTADAAGNLIAQQDRITPVENLVAEGFGTLTTSDVQDVGGVGVWSDGVWRVLFVRDLAPADADLAAFSLDEASSVAFAVWDGGSGDRNGQKSIASFIQLQLVDEEATPPGGSSARTETLLLIVAVALGVFVAYGATRIARSLDD